MDQTTEVEPEAATPSIEVHDGFNGGRITAYKVAHANVAGYPKGELVWIGVFSDEQVERFLGLGAILPIYEA